MKITRGRLLILFIFIASLCGASSCGDEPEGDNAGQETLNQLTAHTWVPGKVMHETDGDLTAQGQYESFSIKFSSEGDPDKGGTYSVNGGESAFPANSGTWSFVSNSNYSKIEREDGVIIDIDVSDDNLNMQFNVPESTSARMSGTSGDFEFDLQPQQ